MTPNIQMFGKLGNTLSYRVYELILFIWKTNEVEKTLTSLIKEKKRGDNTIHKTWKVRKET